MDGSFCTRLYVFQKISRYLNDFCTTNISFCIDLSPMLCGDNLSFFTNVRYFMEFINCVLEGENYECQCQKRQDKVLGINRECFDYSDSSLPTPSIVNSSPSLVIWSPLIFKLLFFILINFK